MKQLLLMPRPNQEPHVTEGETEAWRSTHRWGPDSVWGLVLCPGEVAGPGGPSGGGQGSSIHPSLLPLGWGGLEPRMCPQRRPAGLLTPLPPGGSRELSRTLAFQEEGAGPSRDADKPLTLTSNCLPCGWVGRRGGGRTVIENTKARRLPLGAAEPARLHNPGDAQC